MKQCVLADNANQCFWWLFEYDGESDPKFANFDKELTKADFNCATVCNLCCPEGTWTLDNCVLKWGSPVSAEFENRPVRPIREFVSGGYSNDKLQINELIQLLDSMQIVE